MNADVMSLSTFGVITDPIKKIDELYAIFYASDYSQSNYAYGQIQSLAQIVQSCGSDYATVPTRVETALRLLFRDYFDEVSVNIKIEKIDTEGVSYRLLVDMVVVSNGTTYPASRIAQIENSQLMKYPDNYI